MTTKKCFKCLVEWPIHYFYAHSGMKDGYLNKCKNCTKKDSRKNRSINLEYYRQYDRDRFQNNPERRKITYAIASEYRKKYPERYKAHNAVNNAVRDGRLIKKPCCVCGSLKSHGHHEDYSKPLEVVWVCAAHHRELE